MYNYNAALYSDDRGRTWQVSDGIMTGTGEAALAELSDGRIYYNSRCHMAVDHRRRIAWSHDGGAMFVDWRVSEHLYEVGEPFYFKYGTQPSYGCNAGLVRLPLETTGGKDVLLFSTPDNPGGSRVRMTVWASFDRGETWPVKRLVNEGPSAYSSLAAGPEGSVYLLFERGEQKLYDRMAVARFNLAWLADVAHHRTRDGEIEYFPDSLVGTDSHTVMINGLGVVGWGVGGIEAEAVMLGQPYYMSIPQVIGVKFTDALRPGVTATDLVLTVTQMLREYGVVEKFVEYFGPGLKQLTVPDRATISNMTPEYGASAGLFYIDEQTIDYLKLTGRDESQVRLVESYAKQAGLWADDLAGALDHAYDGVGRIQFDGAHWRKNIGRRAL